MRLPNKLEELRVSIEDVCLDKSDSELLRKIDSMSRTSLLRINPIRTLLKERIFHVPIGMSPTRFGQ